MDQWIAIAVWLAFFTFARFQISSLLPDRDPYLMPIAALLSGWGLLTVWRLMPGFGVRQMVWLAITLMIFVIGLRLPGLLTWLRRYKYVWLTGGLLLLAATFVLGTYPDGSGAGPGLWLGCCGLYLQPSEMLKLLLVVYLAAFLADHADITGSLGRLITPSLVLTGLAMLMLVVQRDLGTASIFLVLYTATVYAATGRRRVVLIGLVVMLTAVIAGYYLFVVVRLRMDAWLNPWADPSGSSYQIVQSMIAIASGGVLGKGMGLGSPGVVPVAQSDFIFSAIAEENGLVGIISLLGMIGLFSLRGLRAAVRAPDAFQRSLAAGLTTFLAAQSILIIGGNLRLLPLTGVTLPFVSYGGSSLVTSFACLLLILKTSSHPDVESAPLSRNNPFSALGVVFLAGLAAAAGLSVWWALVRAPALLTRSDNPRLSINDRYVPRGAILDRNGLILNQTKGVIGTFSRAYNAPTAAAVAGYTNPVFGRTGLENSFDATLRGLEGNTPNDLFWYGLLYGQPPPGRDIRISLNINLQNLASEALEGQKGAVVLLNAQSGEVLVMATNPGFNPATIIEDWPQLIASPDAPLINRATQGLYPAGSALAPFIFTEEISQAVPGGSFALRAQTDPPSGCLDASNVGETIGNAISAGCQSVVSSLSSSAQSVNLEDLLKRLGLFETPEIPLDTAPAVEPASRTGSANLDGLFAPDAALLSPMQMTLAAASLSNGGIRPSPRLVMAYNDSIQGWTLIDQTTPPTTVFAARAVDSSAQALASENNAFWSALGTGLRSQDPPVTWYLAGTLPGWQGTRLALVVLVEGSHADLAKEIGEKILFASQGG